jgi:poly(3-hydroxybutyrate) depolymerase
LPETAPTGEGLPAPATDLPTSTPGGDTGPGISAPTEDSFTAPEPVGCITDVAPGKHEFACDGIRHFVTVPDVCVTRACGLIVDVHGGTMDAAQEENNTNLSALGLKHEFLVVQPSAFGNNWLPGPDDDRIAAFMEQAFEAFRVDRKRVHMTGFSQGGYMTWRFLCKHADWFASVAPGGAGPAVPASPPTCAFTGAEMPAVEVPILQLQGTKDVFVAVAATQTHRDTVVAAWQMLGPDMIAGDAAFRRTRYTSPAGTVYEYLEHDYETDAAFFIAIKGHCYPGSLDHAPTVPGQLMGYGCKGENAFHWGEEAIRFFVEHPRP